MSFIEDDEYKANVRKVLWWFRIGFVVAAIIMMVCILTNVLVAAVFAGLGAIGFARLAYEARREVESWENHNL